MNLHKPGNDSPRVSTTDDIVFAVNIPPKGKRSIPNSEDFKGDTLSYYHNQVVFAKENLKKKKWFATTDKH